MGSFEQKERSYPRLQFWQIDDAYFGNPRLLIRLSGCRWSGNLRVRSRIGILHQMELLK